jgi:hypothetical protein
MPLTRFKLSSIGDGGITTAKLADGSVTTVKVADSAVNSAKIGVDVIAAEDLAANSVTVSEITDGAVTSAKLADDITIAGNFEASSGTIKLDGNYPVGTGNVALGDAAMNGSISGDYNTALGDFSMQPMTSGASNTGVGGSALRYVTSGSYNTAAGHQSLHETTSGANNTAVGYRAGYSNTTGYDNTTVGNLAGTSIDTGYSNTFIGKTAGQLVTTGYSNTVLGRFDGNQDGVDIRTDGYNIILSDGAGNVGLHMPGGHATAKFKRSTVQAGTLGIKGYAISIPVSSTRYVGLDTASGTGGVGNIVTSIGFYGSAGSGTGYVMVVDGGHWGGTNYHQATQLAKWSNGVTIGSMVETTRGWYYSMTNNSGSYPAIGYVIIEANVAFATLDVSGLIKVSSSTW